YAD
ncbi:prophage Qin DNA packaging NU1-like protein, partial [Escherichia coli EC1865]